MFCDQFKKLHDACGLTNKQLSNIIGVSEYAISKYRNGTREPSFQILNKIADYFGVSTDYLLCRTSVKNLNEMITLESFKHYFKDYPGSATKIIESIFSIITNNSNLNKLDSLQLIFNELDNLLKL